MQSVPAFDRFAVARPPTASTSAGAAPTCVARAADDCAPDLTPPADGTVDRTVRVRNKICFFL